MKTKSNRKFTRAGIILFTVALLTLTLSGCGSSSSSSGTSGSDTEDSGTTITVGANLTPHAEILKQAKPILEKEGIDLEIVEIEDSVTPNTGVAEGSLDANYFQHVPYLEDFNAQNNTDLVSIGAIHYEPFGIYAGKVSDLKDLKDGATIAVPNNVTNEARALLLLEQEGLLKLADGAGIEATINDITENPLNIQLDRKSVV